MHQKQLGRGFFPRSSTPFQRQRRLRELDDRPLHVKKKELESAAMWCQNVSHDFLYGVEIEMPEDEAAWRRIRKGPARFVAKSMQKGAEVSWARLDPKQRAAMQEATSRA